MEESRVMFAVSQLKVVHAQHLLSEQGIESFVINKTDSAYPGIIGEIELFVDKSNAERAKKLLEEGDVL